MALSLPIESTIKSLRYQIASCEAQLQDLRHQLADAENRAHWHTIPFESLSHDMIGGVPGDIQTEFLAVLSQNGERRRYAKAWPLEKHEYKRYGRQLIMPEVGLQGQLRLKTSSVLVVGVGGLGCPAAAYLAGAGVGKIGLVDGDTVEESNLHRQILHSTGRVGMTKVESATVSLTQLNPTGEYLAYSSRLTPDTAIEIFQSYDLILDCTDNPASRYLISDTCVLLGKPLVSASALRTEGQLMVLNSPPRPPGDILGGPCYRCIFPKPPPAESVVSCGDGGILGPVVGVMGVLQALEAIKIITRGIQHPDLICHIDIDKPRFQTNNEMPPNPPEPPSLLLFSAYSNPPFRSIRLRSRKSKCASCSAQAIVTREALTSGSLDYVQFCGIVSPVEALSVSERISVDNYARIRTGTNPITGTEARSDSHTLIDVREKVQFDLCNLEGSINIPFSVVSRTSVFVKGNSAKDVGEEEWVTKMRGLPEKKPIFVICRLGNDSQLAVGKMKELGLDCGGRRWVGDVKGGLKAWRDYVDPEFPEY
ncbi:molybdopterin biosynthesis protein moeB [Glonium stellatum]|uniref:Adenylyltransferase and sulfurtransferase uba4 n=1 Tax=Glonium stellatum TaxID=574774 RepID=A0A8E2JW58_9PEZI|nr:molybdopterin biosynthesis protein moeB [Glonium stellatum]